MSRVIILCDRQGEYEALYVDNRLIDSGNPLGEGDSLMFMLKMAEQHQFLSSEVLTAELSPEDDAALMLSGCFPDTLDDFASRYIE